MRPDGTKTQTQPDGSRLVVHPNGNKVQTSADGTKQEVGGGKSTTNSTDLFLPRPDGRRRQTDADGIVVDVFVDGSYVQTNPDGTKHELRRRLQIPASEGYANRIDPESGSIARIVKAASDLTPVAKPHVENYYDDASGAWYQI